MSEAEKIKARIEKLMSNILSTKYDAIIEIKFRRDDNGNGNQTKVIGEE